MTTSTVCAKEQALFRSRYTGKERDTESGLDYFGARYYGSSMGRFMSPDPLLNSGRPDNPQTWNRYTYVLNNPLRNVDPTGLYNLDAGCLKDKACSKNAAKLKQGIADLTKAVNGMKAGADKDRLTGALKTFGTENDGNNVGVAFAPLAGTAAGHTDAVADAAGNLTGFKVTLDPSKNSSSDIYRINAAHESTHIDNLQSGNNYSDFSDEYRAYQTSAWSAAALWQYHGAQGTGTFTLNGSHGSDVIWNSSWGAVDDKVLTNHIIQNYHYQDGKPYQETTPHDGGKP
jgi:RHS repeat-associated protein